MNGASTSTSMMLTTPLPFRSKRLSYSPDRIGGPKKRTSMMSTVVLLLKSGGQASWALLVGQSSSSSVDMYRSFASVKLSLSSSGSAAFRMVSPSGSAPGSHSGSGVARPLRAAASSTLVSPSLSAPSQCSGVLDAFSTTEPLAVSSASQ